MINPINDDNDDFEDLILCPVCSMEIFSDRENLCAHILKCTKKDNTLQILKCGPAQIKAESLEGCGKSNYSGAKLIDSLNVTSNNFSNIFDPQNVFSENPSTQGGTDLDENQSILQTRIAHIKVESLENFSDSHLNENRRTSTDPLNDISNNFLNIVPESENLYLETPCTPACTDIDDNQLEPQSPQVNIKIESSEGFAELPETENGRPSIDPLNTKHQPLNLISHPCSKINTDMDNGEGNSGPDYKLKLEKIDPNEHPIDLSTSASTSNVISSAERIKGTEKESMEVDNKDTAAPIADNSLPQHDVIMDQENNIDNLIYVICPLCVSDNVFHYKTKASLMSHMSRKHLVSSKRFNLSTHKSCCLCLSSFSEFPQLMEHFYYCKNSENFGKLAKRSKLQSSRKGKSLGSSSAISRRTSNQLDKWYRCCMCYCDTIFSPTDFFSHLNLQHSLDNSKRFPKKPRQCYYCCSFITNFRSFFSHCNRCAVPKGETTQKCFLDD